jgi:hypothetical protein
MITLKNISSNNLSFSLRQERKGSMGRNSIGRNVQLKPGQSIDAAAYCGVTEDEARAIVKDTPFCMTSKLLMVSGLAKAKPAPVPVSKARVEATPSRSDKETSSRATAAKPAPKKKAATPAKKPAPKKSTLGLDDGRSK